MSTKSERLIEAKKLGLEYIGLFSTSRNLTWAFLDGKPLKWFNDPKTNSIIGVYNLSNLKKRLQQSREIFIRNLLENFEDKAREKFIGELKI